MKRLLAMMRAACALAAAAALLDLGLRAALRLELRWDTFWYHLPFAALRGGIPVPYEMTEAMALRFQGFPPLPHLVQGLLWRASGSVNATGLAGYLAFALFLAYSHLALRARFSLVALISLTAPLVVIHCAASYVDLFGNALLAIGLASLLSLQLSLAPPTRLVFLCGLLGLAGAAWSKFQLVAVVGLAFILYAWVCLRPAAMLGWSRGMRALLLVGAALLAAAPYLHNLAQYGNPFWPVRVPFIAAFPFAEDEIAYAATAQTPVPLLGHSGAELFLRSLFEWGLPTRYAWRPRWILDQGSAWAAFRMGGFWGVGTAIHLALAGSLLFLAQRRAALGALAAGLALLGFVALLPQSHDLRYYLFIPLLWAAASAMLYPRLEEERPALAALMLALVAGLFGWMVWENRVHYRIERVGIAEAAREWKAADWWPVLERGQRYCAVDLSPLGLLLTGPTLSEYRIAERSQRALCPAGAAVLTRDRFEPMRAARAEVARSDILFRSSRYRESLAAAERALALNPDSAMALNNACLARCALQEWDEGIDACSRAVALNPDFPLARNNLAWVRKMKAESARR